MSEILTDPQYGLAALQVGLAVALILAAVGLLYFGLREAKRADYWEMTARLLARDHVEYKRQAAPTVIAPQHWSPKATRADLNAG